VRRADALRKFRVMVANSLWWRLTDLDSGTARPAGNRVYFATRNAAVEAAEYLSREGLWSTIYR
jgi:hypothetical protein